MARKVREGELLDELSRLHNLDGPLRRPGWGDAFGLPGPLFAFAPVF